MRSPSGDVQINEISLLLYYTGAFRSSLTLLVCLTGSDAANHGSLLTARLVTGTPQSYFHANFKKQPESAPENSQESGSSLHSRHYR